MVKARKIIFLSYYQEKATYSLYGFSVLGTQALFILLLHHVQDIALIYMAQDGSMLYTHFRQLEGDKREINCMFLPLELQPTVAHIT